MKGKKKNDPGSFFTGSFGIQWINTQINEEYQYCVRKMVKKEKLFE